MHTHQVDVAIIGGGTAGLTARRGALKAGAKRVVMIEGGPFGTTCARVGCMPSKLLISSAEVAHEIRHSARFGVSCGGEPVVDGAAVLSRVRRERDRFAGFVVDAVEDMPPEQIIRGYAHFVGPTTLEVTDGSRVEAAAVVIAAGSSPWSPPVLDDLGDRLITSDEIFELPELPPSLAVIGTGVIGLELGQAMHRLGVRTTLFNRGARLGPIHDADMQTEIRGSLGDELDLKLGAELLAARREEDGVRLRWRAADGREHDELFAKVLSAAGRRANVAKLGLGAAGLEVDEKGIPVFDHRTMQCGDAPIFVAGDFDGERTLLHEAADEGHIAGANAARFPDVRAHPRKTPLSIVFSDPQIAVVGSPGDLGAAALSGEVDYGDQGRARVMGKNQGRVRVWAKRECGHLTGAEMFGPRVEHTAHLLAWAIQRDMTVADALAMPFYHPVVEEGIRTALRDLAAKLKMAARSKPLDCGPGA